MILLYLQTQAIRTGSREVELGRSMRDWLGRIGLSWGGNTGRALREQAARIAVCNLRFSWESDDADGWVRGGFVKPVSSDTQSYEARRRPDLRGPAGQVVRRGRAS